MPQEELTGGLLNSTDSRKVNELRGGAEKFLPRLIFFELTTRCNLRCIHCRAEAGDAESGELTTEEVKRILTEISEVSKPIVILTGGEPLYRKDIFELAGHTVSLGMKAALASNGTLINQQTAEKIREAGVSRVSISLDGGREETHDRFRGITGSFREAVAGIKNLQAAGVQTQINSTIASHNINEVDKILNLALGLKVNALHIFMLVPVGCGVQIADKMMLSPQEYENCLNWFYEQWRAHPELEFKATCAPHFYRILNQRGKKDGIILPKSSSGMSAMTRGCLAGTAVCFISNRGEVQPCGYLPLVTGRLRTQSFRDVWFNSEIFGNLRDPSNLKGKCGRCEFRKLCMGCRARAYYDKDNYMDEEPYCLYEPLVTIEKV